MLQALHHIAIICSDYQRSKVFYTQALGFEIIREVYRAERRSYKLDPALNGVYRIELFSFPNPPQRPSFHEAVGLRHIAFSDSEIATACIQLSKYDVEYEVIRTDEFTGKCFTFFADPDQLPIELYET